MIVLLIIKFIYLETRHFSKHLRYIDYILILLYYKYSYNEIFHVKITEIKMVRYSLLTLIRPKKPAMAVFLNFCNFVPTNHLESVHVQDILYEILSNFEI